jgi:hypothetical protein
VGQTGCGELFAVAAAFYEGFFQGGYLAVEEEVCLVDEADERVCADRRVGVVEPAGVEGLALVVGESGEIGLFRRIGRICRIVLCAAVVLRDSADGYGFGAIARPRWESAVAEEIFVVEQQLMRRSSVCEEVADARLPSAMFWRPERAAWIIWSTVRERGSMNFSQNQTVAS